MKQMKKQMKRRDFIKRAVAASAVAAAPFNILKAGETPNNKLNLVGIGIGSQGSGDLSHLASSHNIIGIADADPQGRHRKCIASYDNLQGIKTWTDYRKMFDDIGDDIDGVYTATPDHARFAVSMFVLKHGIPLYAQKPLCHTVKEVRRLTEESRKRNVATQMGHQYHTQKDYTQKARDWVLDGAVGKVREVNVYCRKNYPTIQAPVSGAKPPKGLDWNLWLNRAEEIPFSESYLGREWIRYSHFSGLVGDMGSHLLDPAWNALGLESPLSVRADAVVPSRLSDGDVHGVALPRAGVVTWEFAARGDMPPVTMRYFLGDGIEFARPKNLEEGRDAEAKTVMRSGLVMAGEDASILIPHGGVASIIPEQVARETPEPPKKTPRPRANNHLDNWTMAIMGEDEVSSPFDYSGPLSEAVVLGDIALTQPGVTLKWDSKNLRFNNNDQANRSPFLQRLNPRDGMDWY